MAVDFGQTKTETATQVAPKPATTPATETGLGGVVRCVLTAALATYRKKGVDTVVLDVGNELAVTDWFIITHGNNARQVKAIVEEVEMSVASVGGLAPMRIEGKEARQWVLLDYGFFVVHVFDAEKRAFYQLENLWADCPKLDWLNCSEEIRLDENDPLNETDLTKDPTSIAV